MYDLGLFVFNFSDDIMDHILISVYLSLLFLRIGLVISEMYDHLNNRELPIYDTAYIESVRKIAKTIMYFALIPQILILVEKAILVQNLGYEAYYTDYESQLPFIIVKLGSLYEVMTFLFLATMPSKKECKLPLILYFIVGSLSFGYGQRTGFVLNSLFIIIYLTIRNQIHSEGIIWFKKKYLIAIIILTPFILTVLLAISSVRSGEMFDHVSLETNAAVFIYAQGNSSSIIGYAMENENILPENKYYAFGPVISFFKDSIIAHILFDIPRYPNHSPEKALNGHQFGQAIAYIQYPDLYLRGGAIGSCYIAELWIDFGYAGIAFGSLIYGWLMAKFMVFCRREIWFAMFAFSSSMMIIYAGRAEFTGFLKIYLSMTNLILFILIHLLAKNHYFNKYNNITK
jgi:oligosaccharide repeat unit polymerase